MKIVVNGISEDVPDEMTVQKLLDLKKINSNVVACELNLQVLKRKELNNITLKEGDTLEIIRMIGGG